MFKRAESAILVGFLAFQNGFPLANGMTANSAKRPLRRKSIVTNRRAATLNANGENDGHTRSVFSLLDILER
jgi:hypothetical protein